MLSNILQPSFFPYNDQWSHQRNPLISHHIIPWERESPTFVRNRFAFFATAPPINLIPAFSFCTWSVQGLPGGWVVKIWLGSYSHTESVLVTTWNSRFFHSLTLSSIASLTFLFKNSASWSKSLIIPSVSQNIEASPNKNLCPHLLSHVLALFISPHTTKSEICLWSIDDHKAAWHHF